MGLETLVPISGGIGLGYFTAVQTNIPEWGVIGIMLSLFVAGMLAKGRRDGVMRNV